MFKYNTQVFENGLVKLTQEMKISSCVERDVTQIQRLLHEMVFQNLYSTIKYEIKFSFSQDINQKLEFCSNESPKLCNHGEKIKEVSLNAPQEYFNGIEKKINTLICWLADNLVDDFNMTVDFKFIPHSPGTSAEDLNGFKQYDQFIVYGKK